MRYSIWRITADGDAFQITSAGNTTNKEAALEKAENLNKKLISSEPGTLDRFIVRDEIGKEVRPVIRKEETDADPENEEKMEGHREEKEAKTGKKKIEPKKAAVKSEKPKKKSART